MNTAQTYKYDPIYQVKTDDIDGGGDRGREYYIHYTLYSTINEHACEVFEMTRDDGEGNGTGDGAVEYSGGADPQL